MNKMLIVKQISSVLHKIARKLISIKELWVQTLETKGLARMGLAMCGRSCEYFEAHTSGDQVH